MAALANDNQLWRLHAQRMLIERNQTDVVPGLIKLVRDQTLDGIGLNPGAIHALWTLHGLGAIAQAQPAAVEAAVAALAHPSAGVRRNAVQVLPRDAQMANAIVNARLMRDPDAQVRLAALLALADQPASDAAAAAIVAALRDGAIDGDPLLAEAATAAAARNDAAFLKALTAKGAKPAGAATLAIAARVAEHWARGGPGETAQGVLAALPGGESAVNEAIIRGLARGWPKDRPAHLDKAGETALQKLMVELSCAARAQLVRLASLWGNQAFDMLGSQIAGTLLGAAQNDKLTEPARLDAARQLVELRASDLAVAKQLLKLIVEGSSPELAAGILDAVAQSKSPEAGAALAETPAEAAAAGAIAALCDCCWGDRTGIRL